ncbi:hypothetical protein QL886_06570 [Psychrobacter sp. APC 3281]|uniref:hypothetical protein n=1 Tax=Psychrobacter sp. APC 3281 TaxID=3035190 RepID=UPI0025B2FB88|nr:hypothetical protein [Psychrobacter sp. APC 3281]MDN3447300.1 hypothetical protein [Psychrobacter sp. APC 3281]
MTNNQKGNSMAKRLISMMVIATASMWALTGCDNATDSVDATEQTAETAADPSASTADTIDWSLVDSGAKPADPTNYKYPFAIDSQNVRDYADYFKVDAATAQHNLTVSMASNEALSKALDQLSETYVSHELTDGNEMTLIIHTTPDVAASRYDYVLSDDFAKGLVLPIVIQPDGKKGDVKTHGEMAE